MWRHWFASWNPNKYQSLRELSIGKLLLVMLLTSFVAAIIFWALLTPTVFDAGEIVGQLGQTTNVTISAHLTQSAPTYLLKNPDVLVTTGQGDGFIVITPQGISIKRFVFFGYTAYAWQEFSSLQAFPAGAAAKTAFMLLFPSLVFWTALFFFLHFFILVILYTFIAYFVLHARDFHITYDNVWRPSVYATIPALLLAATTPILRLGLPLAIVWGLCFALWLVFSLLGTTLFAEKHAQTEQKKPEKRRA